MSKQFKKDVAKTLEASGVMKLFGGMAASNAIGKAMQIALEKGYNGIEIRFIFTEEKP